MIMITTSRRPSPRLRSLVKDLVSVLPRSIKVNRGHKSLVELALEAKRLGLKYVIIVTERKGNPGGLTFYEVEEVGAGRAQLKRLSTIILRGVKLSRENPASSRTYGVDSIEVDYSRCITDDCFYLSDLFIRVFKGLEPGKNTLKICLNEEKFIEITFLNVHNKPVGPVLRVEKVIRFNSTK